MAYQEHDANIIKSVLEHHVVQGSPPDDRLVRDALAALERLVHNYLPEAAHMREWLGRFPSTCANCHEVFVPGDRKRAQEPNTGFCVRCYKMPKNHKFDSPYSADQVVVVLCQVCGEVFDGHLQLDPVLHEATE